MKGQCRWCSRGGAGEVMKHMTFYLLYSRSLFVSSIFLSLLDGLSRFFLDTWI